MIILIFLPANYTTKDNSSKDVGLLSQKHLCKERGLPNSKLRAISGGDDAESCQRFQSSELNKLC